MIRDPSDGTVREVSEDTSKLRAPIETALPPIDTKELERLERARKWLKDYRLVKQGDGE